MYGVIAREDAGKRGEKKVSVSTVARFVDPDEYQAVVRAPGLALYVTERGPFQADLTQIEFDEVWMQRGEDSLARIANLDNFQDRGTLVFPVGPERASTRYNGLDFCEGEMVAFAPADEIYATTSGPSIWGSMSLSLTTLASAGQALSGFEVSAPSTTVLVRPDERSVARLKDVHAAVSLVAARAPEILTHAEVARAFQQELVRAMVACLAEPAKASAEPMGGHRKVLQRFEDYLAQNEDLSVYLPEVCAAIGVSHRTLQLHCNEYLGMGPHHYLWLRRMHLARRALQSADATRTTVTTIANDYGFGELGRFATAYGKLFGEKPSATLHRAPDDRSSPSASPPLPKLTRALH